jgi:DNA-directed RNA polymerase subunit RPC12/RpoP
MRPRNPVRTKKTTKRRPSMAGMNVPEWTEDLKQKFYEMSKTVPSESSLTPLTFRAITEFSTHFAEWGIRENDVLIHFFPRDGKDDSWEEGYYLPKCKRCKAPVPEEIAQNNKPCPSCGHMGLIYVPGRKEAKTALSSLNEAEPMLKKAIDAAWMGDAAVEFMPELGAWVVQLQGAKNTAVVSDGNKLVDKICEEFDKLLEAGG